MTILGWLSDLLIPFNGLSDLQSGDKKVTLNHLVVDFYGFHVGKYTIFVPMDPSWGISVLHFFQVGPTKQLNK